MNREFLNHFWDLASDDDDTRLKASDGIITYLKSSENAATDMDYVCKRLVRGLSSSRNHARTGFSTCLTELVAAEFISIDIIISLINETTKVTGSLKRGEERDYMLGKLFGALVIMKSQTRLTNAEHIEFLITTFLHLHSWKAWMREIVAESILFLVSIISWENVNNILLPKLDDLVKCPLDDLAAWQIVLLTGLEAYGKSEPQSRMQIKQMLPSESIVSSRTINSLKSTLIAATHGFPKIHRVWNSILGSIFSDYKSFVMGTSMKNLRSSELKRHEEDILISFTDFIDKNLIVNSNEKRGVGYHLLVEMVQHCPVKSLRNCISKRIVRSLVSARINKKHTLHTVAETTLKSIVLAAKDDSKARLILASCLVQYGGANFDQKSKTHTVQSLLEGLDESDVLSHIKQLCELIGTNLGSKQVVSSTQSNAQIDTTNAQNDIEYEPDALNIAQSVIDAMVSLSKNPNILGRYNVIAITSIVLLRIAYFSNSASMIDLLQGAKSKSNKKSKKDKSNIGSSDAITIAQIAKDVFGDSNDLDMCMTITRAFECLDLVNCCDTSSNVFTEDIANYASTKFLSLMSDSGHKNYFQLSSRSSKADISIKSSSDNSLLQVVTNIMALMIDNGCKLRAAADFDREDANRDSNQTTHTIVKTALDYQTKLKSVIATGMQKSLNDKDISKYSQLSDSLIGFISHAIFSVLCSNNGELEALEDIGRICVDLVQNQYGLTKNDDNNEDDSENPQMKIFELSMDFLSAPEDQSIRGIREVIKKVWINIVSIFPILDEVVDSVVSVITDDNDDDDEDGKENIEDEEEEEEEEEDADVDDTETDEMKINDDEEEGKEVIVHEDSMFELLDSEEDLENIDDMEGMLMHEGTPEQDAALAQLIELRKKSRKLGLLNAQKHQFLIRTRAVDILDIFAGSISIDRLLLMIPSFIRTLKSVYASSTLMNMQECLSFCSKLKGLVEDKICKGKNHKKKGPDENSSTEFQNYSSNTFWELSNGDVIKILEEIFVCIKSSIAPLKHVASACLFRICRVILIERFSEMTEAVDFLNLKTIEMMDDFKNKKNSKVSRKLFEELFTRYPDFALSCLLNSLIDGCMESKSIYIQTECCDILTSVLNRFKTLSSVSQQLIIQQSAHNLNSVSKSIEKLYQQAKLDSTISVVCGKRLKTFVLCGKVVIQNLKTGCNITFAKPVIQAIQLFGAIINDLSQLVQKESINKKAPNSKVIASLMPITTTVLLIIKDVSPSDSTCLELPSKKRMNQSKEIKDETKRKKKVI